MPSRARTESRKQLRARQLAHAADTPVPDSPDVIVCGGGAAGLAAAIASAERGATTVVLERDAECGRSILATGNGRCNLSNLELSPDRYNDPSFVAEVVGKTFLEDTLSFLGGCGLAWRSEEGRLYPTSNRADSVRSVLLSRARRAGVVLAGARDVRRIERTPDGLSVTWDESFSAWSATAEARAVVVATGGGVLEALSDLQLDLKPTSPVLCPLACEASPVLALDGRRACAEVTLLRQGTVLAREAGEVLLRGYGLSGIVLFDLSRLALPGDVLSLDLLADVPEDAVRRAIELDTADGLLDPELARVLGAQADVAAALERARHVRLTVKGLAETDRAQVMRGGLANWQFDPRTLGARSLPGLFACGEVLDVDGVCGGFNLSWAWRSGEVAGTAAAARAQGGAIL